nr:hypothetical protein [Tanacetum cinerariifolium]
MDFVSSPSPNSTNEVPADFGVSTGSPQVSTANLSYATVYAFLANQPNGSQLMHEYLEQIHMDDLKEIDLKWQLALLSMRAKRFFEKTGKKITINGSDIAGYDKYKVEDEAFCKRMQSAKETGKQNQESRKHKKDTECGRHIFQSNSDSEIVVLKCKLEKISNEKDALETKIEKFENASQSLDKLIVSQVTDNRKKGLGYVSYNFIPPPHTGRFSPPRIDLSHTGLPKFAKPSVQSYAVKPIEVVTQKSSVKISAHVKENNGAPLIEDWESDEEDEGHSHKQIEDQGYFNSRCSQHMTGNISYLTDFNEFDGGYVAFGGGAKGIKREYSVARTLQQNRVAERRNKTLIEAARTMLADSKLPITIWAELVNTACYVQNRVLVAKPYFKTPYELFRGRTPALSFMRPFGSHVTILNTFDHLGKFDGKSDEGFFVGYSTNSKAFRVYNTRTRKVEENMHIKFLENKPLIAGKEASFDAGQSSMETRTNQDYILMPLWNDSSLFDSSLKALDGDNQDNNGPNTESEIDNQERPNAKQVNTVRLSDDFFGTDNDMRSLDRVELDTLVDLPRGKRAIGIKWVFRNKKDERGIIIRNKARLVAQRCTQEKGIDYDEVFAPVERIKAIRLFFSYASFMGFLVYQMDVKSAFLYGRIEEEVYVCQPPGFEDPDYPDKVYKVEKALYGLHQASRAWYETLANYLLGNGFRKGLIKPCSSRDKKMIFCLYKYVKPASTPMDKEKALLKDSDGDDVDVHLYRSMIRCLTSHMVEFDIGQEDDQFWRTVSVKTLDNGEIELNAAVDGQVKTITKASVMRHLKLADADGISTLPTTEIFEQLALMGYVTASDKLTFQKGYFFP